MESRLKAFVGKITSSESANILVETAKDVLNVSKDKFKEISAEFLHEIDGLKPIIVQCGFIVKDINVTFPLPAELKMSIEKISDGKKTLEQILQEADGESSNQINITNTQKTILNLMIKANELAVVTNQYGYTFKKYDVVLSATPKVTLHLVSNKPASQ